MNLDVKWLDKKPKQLGSTITVNHEIDGKNAKLLQFMLQIQIAHGAKDITWDSSGNPEYPMIRYHLTRKQARRLVKLLDGLSYDDIFTFETYGTYEYRLH